MAILKVSGLVFFVLLGLGICSATRALFTLEEGVGYNHGSGVTIAGEFAAGGGGGGSGGGGGGGYGAGGAHGAGYGSGGGEGGGAGYGGGGGKGGGGGGGSGGGGGGGAGGAQMTAHVGDFGLAKLIPVAMTKSHPSQSSSIGLKGTIAYAAPEYGTGSKVSPYGDVYSYGILLLEMFTGKRPTDSMFRDGLDLHKFAEMGLPEQMADILDPIVLSSGVENEEEIITTENGGMVQLKVDQMQECLISIVRIGVACSVESPRERMDIGDVVKELQLIKDILRASRMNYSSISRSTRFDGSSSRRSATE